MGLPLLRSENASKRLMGRGPHNINWMNAGLVRALHTSYALAGSEVIYTNTFGAHPMALEREGTLNRFDHTFDFGMSVARYVADRTHPQRPRYVAGCIGPALPTPRMLVDQKTFNRVRAGYRRVIRKFCDERVDFIAFETMCNIDEVNAVLAAIRMTAAEFTEVPPVHMSFTPNSSEDYALYAHGNAMDDRNFTLDFIKNVIASDLVDSIGLNCMGVELLKPMADLLLSNITDMPFLFKPSADKHATPGWWADEVSSLRTMNPDVRGLGGCCGTDNMFIAALDDALQERAVA
jgi:5-methyltetrahydrofolate--homocysteine methyltransferase